MSNISLVRVIKPIIYTNDDGTIISAQVNSIYKLIKKANDEWWYVESKDGGYFYLPTDRIEEFRAGIESDRPKKNSTDDASKEQRITNTDYDEDVESFDEKIPRTYSGSQKKRPNWHKNEAEVNPQVNRGRKTNDDMLIENRFRSKDYHQLRSLHDDSARANSMRIPKASNARSLSPAMEGRNTRSKNIDQSDRHENMPSAVDYEHITDFKSLAEEAKEETGRRDKREVTDARNTKERRDNSADEWYGCRDNQDRTYYYNSDRSQSKWDLPDIRLLQGERVMVAPISKEEPDDIVENFEEDEIYQTSADTLALANSGIVTRKKLLDVGKVRVKKMSWIPLYVELRGFYLVFYKDVKLAKKVMSAFLDKQESKCDIRGAGILLDCSFSKKKNVMLIACQSGLVFMLHFDRRGEKAEWFQKLDEHIRKYSRGHRTDPVEYIDGDGLNEVAEIYNESEQSFERLRMMLKRLLARRPPVDVLKQKGILREQIFGCPLDSLCEREQGSVPLFVQLCLSQIEKYGLDNEGLYRVGGNMALVNKIKYMVDQELKLDLEDDLWKDVPVLTSAIKLYFRELPESLLSKSLFDDFIIALSIIAICF
ncbi:uncharacterized protein TRIADDRAFT_55023 [Trichoplax adhaerens]|uniref:Rho GTPase-activating protein 12 n=1 Tax=Trichoplax adhaerens TaxID=10228 RepID=B3RQK6_TRIAD|nr:hypothetical protein TRIADDRAFT_55023 [Trichoplax adhaerens]EDV27263.1 hypothetical protein TRIADDRAFT_55023 [Trichoplax adhaerens]|eukprot:XP_002111259.1 hypothetical protein TRIADDRAFT_55023 [Trichoplax adhaerens]